MAYLNCNIQLLNVIAITFGNGILIPLPSIYNTKTSMSLSLKTDLVNINFITVENEAPPGKKFNLIRNV